MCPFYSNSVKSNNFHLNCSKLHTQLEVVQTLLSPVILYSSIAILYHWLAVVKSLCKGNKRKPLSFLLEWTPSSSFPDITLSLQFPDQGICQSRFNVHRTRSQSGRAHFFFAFSKIMTFCFWNVINQHIPRVILSDQTELSPVKILNLLDICQVCKLVTPYIS